MAKQIVPAAFQLWREGKPSAARSQDDRAFVYSDGFDELPDRPLSQHPNDVTKEGPAQIRQWHGKGWEQA
jgi:hypothetical protein